MRLRQRSNPQGLKIRSAADGQAEQERPTHQAHDRHVAGRQEHPLAPSYGDRCDVAKHRPGRQQDGRDDDRGDAERNGQRGRHASVYVPPTVAPDSVSTRPSRYMRRRSRSASTSNAEISSALLVP